MGVGAVPISVTTIAGGDDSKSVDGVGTAARFTSPNSICYSEARDALLITEYSSGLVRCVFPAAADRRAALFRALTSVLHESGVIPALPLISILPVPVAPTVGPLIYRVCVVAPD